MLKKPINVTPKLEDMPVKHRVRLYSPHAGQLKIHNSKARFRCVVCGRRYGKTLMACNEICKFALRHKNSNNAWIAPTYKQSKIAYRLIRRALHKIITYKSDTELRLELPNGAVIQFFSSDNYDALRGNGFHFIVIDEFADVDEKAWKEAIRPTLSDTNGKALLIGTPKGMNFFYEVYQRGDPTSEIYNDFPEWESFSAPTSANPYIRASEIESARKELPEDTFNQEYGAAFLKSGAGVFKGLEECIKGELDPTYEPVPEHVYIGGWDAAKHADYSVLSIVDAHTRRLVYWERLNETDYPKQIKWIAETCKRFKATLYMDVTGIGSPLYDFLRPLADKYGFPVEEYLFTNATKKTLIESLQLAIQHKEIEMPNIPVLVKEMRQFQHKILPSGTVTYEAPPGAHDDTVISLALAQYGLSQPRGPLMWSADGDESQKRTLEMPEQPQEEAPKETMIIETWEGDDEGEWYEMEVA
jgi:hypothetical protein